MCFDLKATDVAIVVAFVVVVAVVELCVEGPLEAQTASAEAFVVLEVLPKRTEKCQAFHLCCFDFEGPAEVLKARQKLYFDLLNGGFGLNGWRRFWTGWTRSKFPDLSWTAAC